MNEREREKMNEREGIRWKRTKSLTKEKKEWMDEIGQKERETGGENSLMIESFLSWSKVMMKTIDSKIMS